MSFLRTSLATLPRRVPSSLPSYARCLSATSASLNAPKDIDGSPNLNEAAASRKVVPAAAPTKTQYDIIGLPDIAQPERNLAKEQELRLVEPVAADVISDAPPELRQRSVRIFKPSKTSNSSGKAGTGHWRVDFDVLQGSARWENPLMGWASTADYMQNVYLKFRTKEDAIHFCEKQNWPFFVQEPKKARIPPKSYAANYDWSPGKLRLLQTK